MWSQPSNQPNAVSLPVLAGCDALLLLPWIMGAALRVPSPNDRRNPAVSTQ
jgi:hypothetical protein